MTRSDAAARCKVAIQRIHKANPAMALLVVGVWFAAWAARGTLWTCIGFGAASLAGISAWWGIPIAVLIGQTLGRAWAWWRREGRVRDIEAAADDAERQARGERA